ncbi:MAG: glutathione synthase [Salinivirgaceae bacterium]|nr:glutathione synthase [Salinivirgaceae bacterium]
MNICFIIDKWESLNPAEDSSLRLIHEAVVRGHNVGITYPNNLTIRHGIAYGFIHKIIKQDKYSASFPIFHSKLKFSEQMLPLAGFDAIFLRQDPPLDPIMLNFLDSVKDDTFIVNDIDGLRKANNKLYPASFHDPKGDIIPITHVSKSKDFLKKVIEESEHDKMILKPLDGFGGSGVIVIETRAKQNINSLLDFYISGKNTESNYVILQEFVEGAEKGDTRVLMLNGEAIGAYKRVPGDDDMRSNMKVGASAHKHVMTKKEKLICKKVGPKLVADGLYFVGLDIISGKLIEINVVSPGGITRINKFNRVKIQKQVIDFIENVIHTKELAINKKRAFKRLIEDA